MDKKNLVIACGCGSNAGIITIKMAEVLAALGIETAALEDLKENMQLLKKVKGGVIALEGCQMMCVTSAMEPEEIALKTFLLAENGVVKGITEVTGKLVNELVEKLKKQI